MGDKSICSNCRKNLGKFKKGFIYWHNEKRFCSIKCRREYQDKDTKGEDIQGRKVGKVFGWSFLVIELFLIILSFPYAGEKEFIGFGSLGGFILVTVFSFIVAFFIALLYGAGRRGKQIGDIIEATHKNIIKNKTSN